MASDRENLELGNLQGLVQLGLISWIVIADLWLLLRGRARDGLMRTEGRRCASDLQAQIKLGIGGGRRRRRRRSSGWVRRVAGDVMSVVAVAVL